MANSNDPYRLTQRDYDEGVDWHAEKSAGYDWSNQIERFARSLKGERVLDVGCGSGRDTQAFLDRGIKIEGLDFSAETIKKCRQKYKQVPFHYGDMRNMKLEDASYDGVWACASVHNLKKEHVPTVMKEFKRVLKPKGILFVSVKQGQEEKILSDQAGQRIFSFFSAQEIIDAIERAGFEVIHEEIVSDNALTGQSSKEDKPDWICIHAIAL